MNKQINHFVQNVSFENALRAKAQLFKETWVSQRKCCFNLQLIYRWLVFSWNYRRLESRNIVQYGNAHETTN